MELVAFGGVDPAEEPARPVFVLTDVEGEGKEGREVTNGVVSSSVGDKWNSGGGWVIS